MTELNNWAEAADRKPLILRGARQVGKTTIVEAFSKRFKQYIYFNLERGGDGNIFNIQDIHQLVQTIFLTRNKQLDQKNDTLLFIDEIQQAPWALNMLRYFHEEYPGIKVIAAGSMLETLLDINSAVPVGRVDYRVMRPVSFPEFLGALDNDLALAQLENMPVNDFAHTALLDLFHSFALVGGMPEIVAKYSQTKDLTALSKVYDRLINAYLDDVEKYGRKETVTRVIRHCIRASFQEAGKRITFNRFGHSEYSSREAGEALRILERIYLISIVYPSITATLPITPDYRKSPRLHVLDTGMMNYFLGIQTNILGTDDLNKIHQGTIIEHLVGQELLSGQFNPLSGLNFWTREKKTSQAEVDYVYPFEGQLIPIEVKSGKSGSLKSLHIFMDEAPHDMAIRFYADGLQLTEVQTPSGKPFLLLSLPYYLASQTPKYIAWLKSEGRSYLKQAKRSAEQ